MFLSLAVSGSNLFAGCIYQPGSNTSGGVFLSTNNGAYWVAVDSGLPTNADVYALAFFGTNLFAGTSGGVYLSTNNGTSWSQVNTGFTDTNVLSLVVSGTNLFAGTSAGVWTRPLSDMITGIKNAKGEVPNGYYLQQNYPNPFNPTTTISFSLPSKSFASLKVFDLIGKEVATIVTEELSAGSYSRQWNASNISSGIYFYRLQAGVYTETKKLILVK